MSTNCCEKDAFGGASIHWTDSGSRPVKNNPRCTLRFVMAIRHHHDPCGARAFALPVCFGEEWAANRLEKVELEFAAPFSHWRGKWRHDTFLRKRAQRNSAYPLANLIFATVPVESHGSWISRCFLEPGQKDEADRANRGPEKGPQSP